jgi:hypothetical protein
VSVFVVHPGSVQSELFRHFPAWHPILWILNTISFFFFKVCILRPSLKIFLFVITLSTLHSLAVVSCARNTYQPLLHMTQIRMFRRKRALWSSARETLIGVTTDIGRRNKGYQFGALPSCPRDYLSLFPFTKAKVALPLKTRSMRPERDGWDHSPVTSEVLDSIPRRSHPSCDIVKYCQWSNVPVESWLLDSPGEMCRHLPVTSRPTWGTYVTLSMYALLHVGWCNGWSHQPGGKQELAFED